MSIEIDIWEEVDDNMGATAPDLTTVYVHPGGSVRYSNGRPVNSMILRKKNNRREVARGRLQLRLDVVKEHLLNIDSGTATCFSSRYAEKFARHFLMCKAWVLERGIRRISA